MIALPTMSPTPRMRGEFVPVPRLSSLFAAAIIASRKCLGRAIGARQDPGIGLPDMTYPERIDKAIEADRAPRVDRIEQFPDARVSPQPSRSSSCVGDLASRSSRVKMSGGD